MYKETIYHMEDDFLEKITHESAMAVAIAKFNKAFMADSVKSTKESGYIINLYYQHKERAINDILSNYEIVNK